MINGKRIGIALSGGGYRAAAFHIGTLRKLRQLNILESVDVISTISGGSITGAAYCLHQGDFTDFEEKIITGITKKSIVGYVLKSPRFLVTAIPASLLILLFLVLPFTKWAILTAVPLIIFLFLLVRYQFKLLPVSKIIERAYDELYYNGANLSDLCSTPELAIGGTNLQTMRPFTFSKRKMEDSAYAYYNPPILFDNTNFPLARAVAASTCVPFAFSPIKIEEKYFQNPQQSTVVEPIIVDGGIYDNQGIHKLTQKNSSYGCDVVIVSDAGNTLPFRENYGNTYTLLLRSVNVFMARIKHFQMVQNIYENNSGRQVAYQSLSWNIEECIPGFISNMKQRNVPLEVLQAHKIPQLWIDEPIKFSEDIRRLLGKNINYDQIYSRALPADRLKRIRQIGTNLTCLKRNLVDDMIIHAENLTEIQIRLYCPIFIT